MKHYSLLYYLLAAALAGLLLVLCLFLYFPPYDYSFRETASRHTFGSAMQTLADPYYEAVDNKLRGLAEGRGDVLVTRDARQRADKQLEQVLELIGQKPDGIFISAVDWQQLTPALEEAERAGIPIIALDASPEQPHTAVSVSTDPFLSGTLCAQDLGRRQPQARVLLLGQPGNRYADEFARGFREALPPGCAIVCESDGGRQLAASSLICDTLLAEHPDINAIAAANDQSAIGALAALERIDRQGQVLVYGVDGSPQARAAVRRGLMAGTAARYPYEVAQLASDAMYALLDGSGPEETALQVSVRLLTGDSLGNFETTSWQ